MTNTIIDQAEIYRQLNLVLGSTPRVGMKTSAKFPDPDLSEVLEDIQYTIIECVLLHTRGNQKKAARILGINRGTIRKYWLAKQRSRLAGL